MTERERKTHQELHARLLLLTCQTRTILSDCRDADGRVIAQQDRLRRGILAGIHELCAWVEGGCHGGTV